MLVTHTLPQKIETLNQGQMDIAFGMPLKREVKRQFTPYDTAYDNHPLHKLMTFFSKSPATEQLDSELLESLPFPALYGMNGDEGFAISPLLLNYILKDTLGLTDFAQKSQHFSEFELVIIIKALEEMCGKLTLSTECTLLEPLMQQNSVNITRFYVNNSDVTLQLFTKSSKPKLYNVILAQKMVTQQRLEGLRIGDTLVFENINSKEVHLAGENTPYLLVKRNNQFFIENIGEVK